MRIPLPKKIEKVHRIKKKYNRKRDKKEMEKEILGENRKMKDVNIKTNK